MQLPRNWCRAAAWLAVFAWAATIVWLSGKPGEEIEELNVLEVTDKVAHFAAFLVGGGLLTIALRWSTAWPWRKIALAAALAIALFGAADEYHQTFTPNRSGADVFDWIADALGAVAGAALTALVYARFTGARLRAPADARGA
jgi:VanZ family protein